MKSATSSFLDSRDAFGRSLASDESSSSAFTLPSLPIPLYFAASSQGNAIPGSAVAVTPLLNPTLVRASNINTNPFGIELVWDSTINSSPSSVAFQAGVVSAAQLFDNVLLDNITVNLQITNKGTTGASAGPTTGLMESYVYTTSNLASSHPADQTFAKLPNGNTIQNQPLVAVWNAQLKLWGLSVATNTPILNGFSLDGVATFGLQINSNALVGVVLHELHHALGGIPYGTAPDIFDLFRFTAPGKMLFTAGSTAPAAYFSIDNGITKLAYFGMTSDPSDFFNGTPAGGGKTVYNTSNDAFSEFYTPGSTYQYLTAVDLHLLDALGYHLSKLPVLDVNTFINGYSSNSPVVISDSASTIQASLDQLSLNTSINKIYSISATPGIEQSKPISISAAQSVNDQSILMLMSNYQDLKINITGTSNINDTIIGAAGTDTINGMGGIDTVTLNYHTTRDVIWDNSAVSSNNLVKVSGFLPTDNITLANITSSLNGLTDLFTGTEISAGTAASTLIKSTAGGSPFSVLTSADLLDITGKKFTSLALLISDLATSGAGHTYVTFGNTIASGRHILVEYNGSDGLCVAEIIQGANAAANHLAASSTGVDLIDLVGVTQHLTPQGLTIGIA